VNTLLTSKTILLTKHYILGVSSQRRKSRKAHFTAPSSIRRRMMSCRLSKELRTKYDCRSIPVRMGDTVHIKTGSVENGVKGKTGKVITVYRRRWCIHVEKVVRDKKNGSQVQIPVNPSNCEITQLKLDKSRKALLQRKNRSAQAAGGDQD
jgi:large subunit ribosomal protein L26e